MLRAFLSSPAQKMDCELEAFGCDLSCSCEATVTELSQLCACTGTSPREHGGRLDGNVTASHSWGHREKGEAQSA